jgi:hypothetical protein
MMAMFVKLLWIIPEILAEALMVLWLNIPPDEAPIAVERICL